MKKRIIVNFYYSFLLLSILIKFKYVFSRFGLGIWRSLCSIDIFKKQLGMSEICLIIWCFFGVVDYGCFDLLDKLIISSFYLE